MQSNFRYTKLAMVSGATTMFALGLLWDRADLRYEDWLGLIGRADAAGESIRGTVAVSPELVDRLPTTGSLFVIARPRGVAAGPPLAVLRITAPRFPVSFELGPENVMIPSMRFEGEIQISARLDFDGDAMTLLPGDLSGAAGSSHAPGASGVDILLDTRL